jgi:hypothetical protein
MAKPGFYNDNEYRAYPFIARRPIIAVDACGVPESTPQAVTTELPTSAIVDAGFIMGLDSEFDEEAHSIYLASITRAGAALTFEFKTNAPGAADKPILFTRQITDSAWLNESAGAITGDPECALEPAWEGFVVTGPLTDLLVALPANGTLTFAPTDYVVEPGRVQSLIKSYVRSINIGNYARVMATNEDCDQSSAAIGEREIIVNARCMAGDLKFKEGYNCLIQQINRTNAIRVGVSVTSTPPDAELCAYGSELPLYAGEIPPAGSKFLSGGPACDEVISTINGLVGPNVQLVGGTGVKIVTTQNENKITIQLAKNSLTTEGCE